MTYTKADKLKKLRARAAELGMTFKRQHCYINGFQAYYVEDRTTGRMLSNNHTIESAWDSHVNTDFMSQLK